MFVDVPSFSSAPPSSRAAWCGAGILIVVIIFIAMFWSPFWSSRSTTCYGNPQGEPVVGAGGAQRATPDSTAQNAGALLAYETVGQRASQKSTRPFNEPSGQLPTLSAAQAGQPGCANPQPPQPMQSTAGVAVAEPSVPGSLPQPPRVSGALVGGNVGSAQIDASTYAMSPDSAEYYKHFKPVALESTMPMGWRTPNAASKCPAAEDDLYSEFSRYAISPNQMKRAENMRSVLRLSEMSRGGLSRTLGQRSLLRDFVTPLGPNPIGDKAMLWNDSSVRQNYIASSTGRFPEVSENC